MTTSLASRTRARRSPAEILTSFLLSFPDRAALICLGVFLVVSVTTTFDVFDEWLVIPGSVVVIAVLWRFLPRQTLEKSRAGLWGAALAVVVAVVFFVANAPFVSEWFDPTRDPGLYLLGGVWLMHHSSAGLDVGSAIDTTQGLKGLSFLLGNFGPDADQVVHLQGGDLLPGMIGLAGFFGGIRAGLTVNLLIGAVGLLAVYGLARRILAPLWALVPQLALGLSVAYMFFARGTYSEIIMLLVCAAGLTWLISAVRSGSTRDFVVSGVFLGAATMTRIDGPIAFIGAAAVLALGGLGFVSRTKRRSLARGLFWFFVSVVATTVVGLLGLALNKTGYVTQLLPQARQLWAVGLAVCVVTGLLWLIGRRIDPTRAVPFWRGASWWLAGATASVLLFWLSRPLWLVERHGSTFQQNAVGALQKADGLTVDVARSYEEQTMAWIGWYFGWPLVGMAIIGFALLVFFGVRRRSLPLLITAAAPLAVAALYFTRVSITPDQVWAYRRLLPIVTPGFLIAAVFPLKLLWQARRGKVVRALTIVVAASITLGPVVTWNGLLLQRDRAGQYGEIETICAGIAKADPTANTVLLVRDGAPINYALAVKATCGVDVVSAYGADLTDAVLTKLASRTGAIPVLSYNLAALPDGDGGAFSSTPLDHVVVPSWEADLDTLPETTTEVARSTWVGLLETDGTIVPAK